MMAEMSPVELLRAAAADLRTQPEWAWDVVKDVAEPLAAWLEHEADQYEIYESTSLSQALRVARVLLGVPDGR